MRQETGQFNRNGMTLAGRLGGYPEEQMPAADRAMRARMLIDPTDILDANASTYTHNINYPGLAEDRAGQNRPGERVRLRIINAPAGAPPLTFATRVGVGHGGNRHHPLPRPFSATMPGADGGAVTVSLNSA